MISSDSAQATPKQEVKACYQCKGEDACRPERLSGSEIRTSGAFGAKNLYCFTVCARVPLCRPYPVRLRLSRNSIPRQAPLLPVVVSDSVKVSTRISNVMPNTICAATRICATLKRLASALNHSTLSQSNRNKSRLNQMSACSVCLNNSFLLFFDFGRLVI